MGVIYNTLLDSNDGDLSPHASQTIYFSNKNENKISDRETPVELLSLELQYVVFHSPWQALIKTCNKTRQSANHVHAWLWGYTVHVYRDHSGQRLSQWETTLHYIFVSHWLSLKPEGIWRIVCRNTIFHNRSDVILAMGSSNEIRLYTETSSLIGCAYSQNDIWRLIWRI